MMRISHRKLVLKVDLKGKRFRVSEDAIIDTGASFSVIPPEIADYLELEVDKGFPRGSIGYCVGCHCNFGQDTA